MNSTLQENSATESSIQQSPFEFKISQENFYQAIGLVARAVAKHPLQPILNNILLRLNPEKQTVYLAGTDLDLALAVESPAEFTGIGEITIPAQKLTEIVSKLPKAELTVKINDQASIFISSGRTKFEIKGIPAKEFPEHVFNRVTEQTDTFALPLENLKQGCDLVSYASDKKEVNSILYGICLEIGPNGIEIAATDGSRLAYYGLPEKTNSEAKKVIIPFKTIEELKRMINDVDDQEIQCTFHESSMITLQTEGRMISSNLIEGTYPKYQQLIPDGYIHKAKVNRQSFISSLERVAVLANEKSRVIKLLFEEIGVLSISANTPEIGDAQDQMDLVEYEGQDFTIAFNVNYMIECLKNLSCDEIELHMSESLKPIVVKPMFEEQNFNYIYLLMPIQVRN